MLALKIFIIVFILVLLIIWLFPVVEVSGCSMYPTYNDGDIIIATRLFFKFHKDRVYIYRPPYESEDEKYVIKRLNGMFSAKRGTSILSQLSTSSILRGKKKSVLYFLGDNPPQSYDSRHYGAVSSRRVKYKVLFTICKKEDNCDYD